MKAMNAFQLKMIALVVMFLDHLYLAFPESLPLWIHPLSRFVAPLFVYMMVEGFFHTRNRVKYQLRLFGCALLMQAGNMLLNHALEDRQISVDSNIFLTLAIGFAIIGLFTYSRQHAGFSKASAIIGASLLIACGFAFAEGGVDLILFTLLVYFFRGHMRAIIIGCVLLTILLLAMLDLPDGTFGETLQMLMLHSDFLLITVIPFLLLYNGQRGAQGPVAKYGFYVFYPLHLWGLAALAYWFAG